MGVNGRAIGRPVEARLELWRKRFQDFAAATCTVEQFCKQVGVTAATFYYWRKKLTVCNEVRPSSVRSGEACAGVRPCVRCSTPDGSQQPHNELELRFPRHPCDFASPALFSRLIPLSPFLCLLRLIRHAQIDLGDSLYHRVFAVNGRLGPEIVTVTNDYQFSGNDSMGWKRTEHPKGWALH